MLIANEACRLAKAADDAKPRRTELENAEFRIAHQCDRGEFMVQLFLSESAARTLEEYGYVVRESGLKSGDQRSYMVSWY